MKRKKVLIMGAAGRDFHNFNTLFRDNDDYEVVAFTATQIPYIVGRTYPTELAGSLYPNGIPIGKGISSITIFAGPVTILSLGITFALDIAT